MAKPANILPRLGEYLDKTEIVWEFGVRCQAPRKVGEGGELIFQKNRENVRRTRIIFGER